jgi:medium-chain acyl-CoA synthetase
VKLVTLRRRSRPAAPPSRPRDELALITGLEEGRWKVPDRFNFARDVVEALALNRKRQALTFLGEDGVIAPSSFFDVAVGSARWANVLREHGIGRGDRMLVVVGNVPDWLEIMLAGLKIGAVAVPSYPRLSAEALEVRAAQFGVSLIVAERAAEDEIAQAESTPDVLYLDEILPFRKNAPTEAPTEDTAAKDLAFILPTTGSTNGAVGVMHTHAATFASRVAAEHWLDARAGDAVWCTADTSSPAALWNLFLGPWSRGATAVLQQRAQDPHDQDPLERLQSLDRLGVTVLCQTPAEYQALADLRQFTRRRPLKLRRLVCMGGHVPAGLTTVFEQAWGLTIHAGYGPAETGIVVAETSESEPRAGSIGRPLAGFEVAVLDEKGRELEPGIEGDLAVGSHPPTLFAGYWEAPEQTKKTFRGDWYVTGDRAVVDEDGYVWFLGRETDVITSGGNRFGPFEVESALLGHSAVAASAAVGARDLERGGQYVRAFVVLEPGVTSSDELVVQLREHAGGLLPEYMVPREVEFLEALPMTPTGRVDRAVLRERPVTARHPVQPLSPPTLPVPAQVQAEDLGPEPPVETAAQEIVEPRSVVEQPQLEYLSSATTEFEPIALTEPEQEHAILPEQTLEETIDPEPQTVWPAPETEHALEAEAPSAFEVPAQPLPDLKTALDRSADLDLPAAGDVTEPDSAPLLDPTAETTVSHQSEPAPESEPALLEPVSETPPAAEPEPTGEIEPVLEVPPLAPEAVSQPESVFEVEPAIEPEPESAPGPPRESEPTGSAPVADEPHPEFNLPSVTEFPLQLGGAKRHETEPSRALGTAPEAGKKGKKSRDKPGAAEEGDVEELTWIRDLSSRLSSYSLADDLDPGPEEDGEPGSAETG